MAANCPLIAFLWLAGALLTAGAEVMNGQEKGCPEGWSLFGTRCFKFFDSKLPWIFAEKSCHSHGASLASIHSDKEHTFIIDLVKEAAGGNRRTWLGGHDAVQEGVWMWTDGSPWDYTNWAIGDPNNHGRKEHFLLINWEEPLWYDGKMNWVQNYICAKEAPPKPHPNDEPGVIIRGGFLCKCTPMTE